MVVSWWWWLGWARWWGGDGGWGERDIGVVVVSGVGSVKGGSDERGVWGGGIGVVSGVYDMVGRGTVIGVWYDGGAGVGVRTVSRRWEGRGERGFWGVSGRRGGEYANILLKYWL